MTLTVEQLALRNERRRELYRAKADAEFMVKYSCKGYSQDDLAMVRALIWVAATATGLERIAAKRIIRNFRRNEPKVGWREEALSILQPRAA